MKVVEKVSGFISVHIRMVLNEKDFVPLPLFTSAYLEKCPKMAKAKIEKILVS